MKVLSLFSGIGAFEKALERLGIKYELAAFSEIDKYATKSYCAIHGVDESMNLGDITKIDEKALPKDIDLITYGFPCQDISIAGKRKGLFENDGTQTRSGLFFDAWRIINATKPRVAIAENVKNLTGKKFKEQFEIVLDFLEMAGYNNYWKVLNAKDYGIPQNRERVFIVSIRKDIDDGNFKFPEGVQLELKLKDMLENIVDDSYFLDKEYHLTHTSGNVVGMVDMKGNECIRRIYDTEKEAPALTTMEGGHRQPKILVDEPSINRVDIPQIVNVRKYPVDCKALCECLRNHKSNCGLSNKEIAEAMGVPLTKAEHWFRKDIHFAIPEAELWEDLKKLLGIVTKEFDESIMTFEEKEGVYEKSERHYFTDGIMPTLTSATAGKEKIFIPTLKVRKLTPKECFRLMGFDDEDFEKAEAVNSNTQLYKQAGNSIVVNVLEALFKNLEPYLKGWKLCATQTIQ